MSVNILIVILSHHKNKHLWKKILEIESNSIIFCGNPDCKEEFIFKDNILTLKCKDTYDCLPEKVFLMIQSILKIPEFNNITHILKIDDHDTKFTKDTIKNIKKNIKNILEIDYCGQNLHGDVNNPHKTSGSKTWHFNKCPSSSIWYNKKYEGPFVPWIDGGCGYILSRKSLELISKENINEIKNHIYEDTMIALFLFKNNIFPKKIPNIIKGDK
jgi:hypothetical protein